MGSVDLVLGVDQVRSKGTIGASDAAAALGLSKYTSPLVVWKKLRGMHIDEDRSPALEEAAEFGQLIEPVIRGRYAVKNQRLVHVPTKSFVLDGWLHATPDGLVDRQSGEMGTVELDGDAIPPTVEGMLQVKNRHAFARDDWRDGVPAPEQAQIRVELAVCNLQWSDCAVLIGGNRMLVHRVERDLALEDRIITDLSTFMRLVREGTEPSPDHTAAWRQHVSEKMRPTKVVITPDDELRELVDYWLEQRRKRKRYEEEEEAAKTDIMLRLSAAGATGIDLGERGKVTAYKTGARTDWKAWAQSLNPNPPPQKYVKESKTWALKAPADDDD